MFELGFRNLFFTCEELFTYCLSSKKNHFGVPTHPTTFVTERYGALRVPTSFVISSLERSCRADEEGLPEHGGEGDRDRGRVLVCEVDEDEEGHDEDGDAEGVANRQ